MQLNVAPESYAALKSDGTLRCLAETRFQSPSRRSSVAIALAQDLVNEITEALLANLAQTELTYETDITPTADVKLNAVTLRRNRLLICFDAFLAGCPDHVRTRIDESVGQPIHAIYKLGDSYQLQRNPALDGRVAREYAALRRLDKGPRPYFSDNMNPPVYDDGIRIEDGPDWLFEDRRLPRREQKN